MACILICGKVRDPAAGICQFRCLKSKLVIHKQNIGAMIFEVFFQNLCPCHRNQFNIIAMIFIKITLQMLQDIQILFRNNQGNSHVSSPFVLNHINTAAMPDDICQLFKIYYNYFDAILHMWQDIGQQFYWNTTHVFPILPALFAWELLSNFLPLIVCSGPDRL